MIKILQYVSVITSEFHLYRYHRKNWYFADHNLPLSKEQADQLKLRFKTMGSAFSTSRMAMRFGNGISPLIELIDLLKDLPNTLKTKRGCLDLVMQVIDIGSCVFDNWVFLKRIGLTDFTTHFQKEWVDWLSSFFTVTFIVLSIVMKFCKTWVESVN